MVKFAQATIFMNSMKKTSLICLMLLFIGLQSAQAQEMDKHAQIMHAKYKLLNHLLGCQSAAHRLLDEHTEEEKTTIMARGLKYHNRAVQELKDLEELMGEEMDKETDEYIKEYLPVYKLVFTDREAIHKQSIEIAIKFADRNYERKVANKLMEE